MINICPVLAGPVFRCVLSVKLRGVAQRQQHNNYNHPPPSFVTMRTPAAMSGVEAGMLLGGNQWIHTLFLLACHQQTSLQENFTKNTGQSQINLHIYLYLSVHWTLTRQCPRRGVCSAGAPDRFYPRSLGLPESGFSSPLVLATLPSGICSSWITIASSRSEVREQRWLQLGSGQRIWRKFSQYQEKAPTIRTLSSLTLL